MDKMIKSDGNGAYIIHKVIWQAAIGLIALLLGVVAYGGQSILSDVKAAQSAVQANEVVDAIQSERIGAIKEQLDRIERKLDMVGRSDVRYQK